VFVLLDSYSGFTAAYERVDGGQWLDTLSRLVADGRQVGVHFVVTADRRSSIPMSMVSSIPRKLVLRLASDDEYLNAGEPAGILSHQSPPGRGIMDGIELQVGVLGGAASGDRQADEIGRLASRLAGAGLARAPTIGILPVEFRRGTLTRASSTERLVVAIGDADLQPRTVPLDQGSIIVSGPPRSGRTTALATIAQAAASQGIPLFHVHVRPTSLVHAPFWGKVGHGPVGGAELLRNLADVAARFGRRVLVAVDDLTDLVDTEADMALTELVRLGREHPVTVVAAVDNQIARRQYSGAVPDMRKDQVGILLQPDLDADGDLLGVSLPRCAQRVWPEGRGFLAHRGAAELIQVALPDPW
jgi:S-DNA-T family DNA segregation ATPase FtsK/SpoIIIE